MNCKDCIRCCHNKTEKEFVIQLTNKERKILNRKFIKIYPNQICPYLKNGCKLTRHKPTVCKIFPLIYRDGSIYQDSNCPRLDDKELIENCGNELNAVLALSKQERDRISTMWIK